MRNFGKVGGPAAKDSKATYQDGFFLIPNVEIRILPLYERPFRQNDCYLNLRFFVSVNFERISKIKFYLVSCYGKNY